MFTGFALLLCLSLCSADAAGGPRPRRPPLPRRDLFLGLLANASAPAPDNGSTDDDEPELAPENATERAAEAQPPAPEFADISISFGTPQQAQQVQRAQQQVASSPEGSAPFAEVPALQ
eukprot:3937264-Rhodomonas_salina.1